MGWEEEWTVSAECNILFFKIVSKPRGFTVKLLNVNGCSVIFLSTGRQLQCLCCCSMLSLGEAAVPTRIMSILTCCCLRNLRAVAEADCRRVQGMRPNKSKLWREGVDSPNLAAAKMLRSRVAENLSRVYSRDSTLPLPKVLRLSFLSECCPWTSLVGSSDLSYGPWLIGCHMTRFLVNSSIPDWAHGFCSPGAKTLTVCLGTCHSFSQCASTKQYFFFFQVSFLTIHH